MVSDEEHLQGHCSIKSHESNGGNWKTLLLLLYVPRMAAAASLLYITLESVESILNRLELQCFVDIQLERLSQIKQPSTCSKFLYPPVTAVCVRTSSREDSHQVLETRRLKQNEHKIEYAAALLEVSESKMPHPMSSCYASLLPPFGRPDDAQYARCYAVQEFASFWVQK